MGLQLSGELTGFIRTHLELRETLNLVHQGHAFPSRERSWDLGNAITRSMAAKNAVFMAQPDYDCDVYIDSLAHLTDCQSFDRTQLEAMATPSYNPVRSAIILTIAFLLPLLVSFYSDRLSNIYASLWSPNVNSAAANRHNGSTAIQIDSILVQQQTVRSHSPMSINLSDNILN